MGKTRPAGKILIGSSKHVHQAMDMFKSARDSTVKSSVMKKMKEEPAAKITLGIAQLRKMLEAGFVENTKIGTLADLAGAGEEVERFDPQLATQVRKLETLIKSRAAKVHALRKAHGRSLKSKAAEIGQSWSNTDMEVVSVENYGPNMVEIPEVMKDETESKLMAKAAGLSQSTSDALVALAKVHKDLPGLFSRAQGARQVVDHAIHAPADKVSAVLNEVTMDVTAGDLSGVVKSVAVINQAANRSRN